MTNKNIFAKTEATPSQIEFPATNQKSRVTVHRIYIKGQQFVMNGLPDKLHKNWNSQLNMQANSRVTPLGSGQHEVALLSV